VNLFPGLRRAAGILFRGYQAAVSGPFFYPLGHPRLQEVIDDFVAERERRVASLRGCPAQSVDAAPRYHERWRVQAQGQRRGVSDMGPAPVRRLDSIVPSRSRARLGDCQRGRLLPVAVADARASRRGLNAFMRIGERAKIERF
jgi:hypothetical protein